MLSALTDEQGMRLLQLIVGGRLGDARDYGERCYTLNRELLKNMIRAYIMPMHKDRPPTRDEVIAAADTIREANSEIAPVTDGVYRFIRHELIDEMAYDFGGIDDV